MFNTLYLSTENLLRTDDENFKKCTSGFSSGWKKYVTKILKKREKYTSEQ